MSLQQINGPMPFEEIENEGPILVFLHGFPNNYHLWDNQIKAFGENFHILNFNLPGAFDNKKWDRKFYKTNFIQDSILDVLKDRISSGKKCFLIGHDLGCFILEEVGRRFSAHVAGQIFISGMGLPQYADRLKINSPSQLVKSCYAFLLQIPGAPDLARIFSGPLKNSVYRRSNIEKDSSLYSDKGDGFGSIYLYQELGKKLLHTQKNMSYIPTHFIWGEQDKFLNTPSPEEMARFYHHVDLSVLSGGHWILSEKPENVNEIISNFLVKKINLPREKNYENHLSGI